MKQLLSASQIISHKILDAKIAWDRNSLSFEDPLVQLSQASIDEIGRTLKSAHDMAGPEKGLNLGSMPNLRQQVDRTKPELLLSGPGYVIFKGLADSNILVDQWTRVHRVFSDIMGEIYLQDGNTLEMKEVRDRGLTLDTPGARYSDGKHGGGLHTDGVERPLPVPDYFGLLCVRQGATGGQSLLISAYTVHNKLLKSHPLELATLYKPFHFDLRGDIGPDGEKTAFKPIFFRDEKNTLELGFNYHRTYIEAGHAYADNPALTNAQTNALDTLDEYLEDEDSDIVVKGYMSPGDIVFFNNTVMLHGRSSFEDGSVPEQQRLLLRTWIRERT